MATIKGICLLPTPARQVRIPLWIKISVPYLILSIGLAAAAAGLVTQLVLENTEERFDRQLLEAGQVTSELSVNAETRLLETERLLASVEGLAAVIQAGDTARLRSLTFGFVLNDRQEAVEFFDSQGHHILSLHHRPGGNPEQYDLSYGGRSFFSDLEIVQQVLARKSDARGSKYAGLVQTDTGGFLYVAGPVRDKRGRIAGVVLVGRSLAKLSEDLRAGRIAQITLYDPQGKVLYSMLPFPQALTPEVAAQALSFREAGSIKRELAGRGAPHLDDGPFTEILGPWEVRGDQVLGVLGVAVGQNEAVRVSALIRWRIFLLATAAFFLILLTGIRLAKMIRHHHLQQVQASLPVIRTDPDARAWPGTSSKAASPAGSCNSMAADPGRSQLDLPWTYDSTFEGWACTLEFCGKEPQGHAARVTALTIQLARAAGVREEALGDIRRGALLHDIGKMGIPDGILHSHGQLEEHERQTLEQHPRSAYDMLRHVEYLQNALEIPYCHHEKWDGSGYPRGLQGEQIPLSARIFALVDAYDALAYDRRDREALPVEEAIACLRTRSGTHFDPNLLEIFLQILEQAGHD